LTHIYVWHDTQDTLGTWLTEMWRDIVICVIGDVTHSYVWRDVTPEYVTWLQIICDITLRIHSGRDSLRCAVTHSYVWCDMPPWYVTWLTNICDMTFANHSGRDSLRCDVTHNYVWHGNVDSALTFVLYTRRDTRVNEYTHGMAAYVTCEWIHIWRHMLHVNEYTYRAIHVWMNTHMAPNVTCEWIHI